MKKLNVVIEQGEDGFYAFVEEIDGCTAGGFTFSETKKNIKEMICLAIKEDESIKEKFCSK